MTVPPYSKSETPIGESVSPTSFDTLSDLLDVIKLSGSLVFYSLLSAPWELMAPDVKHYPSRNEHSLTFHFVTKGRCSISMSDGKRYMLERGDLAVFPFGDRHAIVNGQAKRVVELADIVFKLRGVDDLRWEYGGGGEETQIICGVVYCKDGALVDRFCRGLPRLVHLKTRGIGAIAMLGDAIEDILKESHTSGVDSGHLLTRLVDVLIVEAMRKYLEEIPPGRVGLLAALNDPLVGRALQYIHSNPFRRWTVDLLSKQVGCSRSLLATRFKVLLGQPPMQYLASWRVQLAVKLLRSGETVPNVAIQIGYSSEAAFSRAFKRWIGYPPVTWLDRTKRQTV